MPQVPQDKIPSYETLSPQHAKNHPNDEQEYRKELLPLCFTIQNSDEKINANIIL